MSSKALSFRIIKSTRTRSSADVAEIQPVSGNFFATLGDTTGLPWQVSRL